MKLDISPQPVRIAIVHDHQWNICTAKAIYGKLCTIKYSSYILKWLLESTIHMRAKVSICNSKNGKMESHLLNVMGVNYKDCFIAF